MIIMDASACSLAVTTSSTSEIDVCVDSVNVNGSTITPAGLNHAAIVSATTTTIFSGPANGQTNIKFVSIYNAGAATNTVTVTKTDSASTASKMFKVALNAGAALIYNDTNGWQVINTGTSGIFIKSTVLTTASSSITTSALTNNIRLRGVGSGGAGGGCTSVASAAGAGGGGGAGSYLEATFAATPSTAYSYTCGVGGAGASGAVGGNGTGTTTFVAGSTYTCNPGTGGDLGTARTTLTCTKGGAGGTVSTNGSINVVGAPGGLGVVAAITYGAGYTVCGGNGASTVFGGDFAKVAGLAFSGNNCCH